MGKKKFTLTEFKKQLKTRKFIIGSNLSLKNLKKGKIESVFLSSNCPGQIEKDINYYAALSKAEILKLQYPNDELGIICKKPFSISVISFLKGEE